MTTGCVPATMGDLPVDIANKDIPLAQGREKVP